MKVCNRCGNEIATRDGQNQCPSGCGKRATKLTKKEREQAMRDLGLTKVRGALGGTYWE